MRYAPAPAVLFWFGSLLVASLAAGPGEGRAQVIGTPGGLSGQQEEYRPLITAVPFLTITPDARSAAMGDAGSALSPDNNRIFYNSAATAFSEKQAEGGISITPWLRNLGVTDMYLGYLSGYYKPSREDAINLSFTYFSLGSIKFTDQVGNDIRDFNPQELNLAAGYSRRLTQNFAIGVMGKFIYSNLTGNFTNSNTIQARPGATAAVDLSGYYRDEINLGGTPAELVIAGGINNFGPKISYSDQDRRDFIPASIRIAPALSLTPDPYNRFTFTVEPSKLLVPSVTQADLGTPGRGPAVEQNLLAGAFGSFSDAPGGFREELSEIMIATGVEYWYDNLLAIRGGYFHEAANKGNRKYFTAGVGLRYQSFGLDISYLIPTTQGAQNPLNNTLRFSFLFTFGGERDQATITE